MIFIVLISILFKKKHDYNSKILRKSDTKIILKFQSIYDEKHLSYLASTTKKKKMRPQSHHLDSRIKKNEVYRKTRIKKIRIL